ncbi:amidohydrolase family protein [Thermocrispum sp.]|uniref:amidohydrolase family protein n=1 Tax=Thermocrispum sp. TaxID=2060768 RepID=UPI00257A3159|nr:amidohydrolase family protein [Thermocrispum sp.]
MSSPELLLRGGTVLVGDPAEKNFADVDLRLRAGRIAEIGSGLAVGDAEVVDYSGCWIIPGFVDAHQHVWQSVLRGMLAGVSHDAAEAEIRRIVASSLAPDDVFAGTFGGAAAMLDAGITCTFDHCDAIATFEHARAAVDGLSEAGIRGVWAYGFDSPAGAAEGRLADAAVFTQLLAEHPLLSFGLAAAWHGDLESFAAQLDLTAGLNAPVLTHTDVRSHDSAKWREAGLLSPRHIHAFCTATPPEMFAEFAGAGCSVVSTPDLELGGGLGYAPLRHAHQAGVTTALGVGSQAVASADMFAVMRLGMQSERMRHQQAVAESRGTSGLDRIALRTDEVMHFATLGGARALGLGDVCGSIEVGKAADLVVLRPDTPRLVPLVDPMVALVMHMGVADIDAVLVAGEFRKRDGRLVGDLAGRAIRALDAAQARLVPGTMREVSA